jgi:hypothetical protein
VPSTKSRAFPRVCGAEQVARSGKVIREFICQIKESPRWRPFHCDVNRLSEHSRTMNRVPEKMSFTHAELESIAGSTGHVMSTSIRSHAAEENVRPATAPATLDTIVARRAERACRQEPK